MFKARVNPLRKLVHYRRNHGFVQARGISVVPGLPSAKTQFVSNFSIGGMEEFTYLYSPSAATLSSSISPWTPDRASAAMLKYIS